MASADSDVFEILVSRLEMSDTDQTRLVVLFEALFKSYCWEKTSKSSLHCWQVVTSLELLLKTSSKSPASK